MKKTKKTQRKLKLGTNHKIIKYSTIKNIKNIKNKKTKNLIIYKMCFHNILWIFMYFLVQAHVTIFVITYILT